MYPFLSRFGEISGKPTHVEGKFGGKGPLFIEFIPVASTCYVTYPLGRGGGHKWYMTLFPAAFRPSVRYRIFAVSNVIPGGSKEVLKLER